MKKIRFSIIVPTYNRADILPATLRSLLAIDYDDYEIIVVDDGSKDNTEEAVKALHSPRITYYRKENGERGAARNYGLMRSTGDYINFFDSDDLVLPNHLPEALKVIEKLGSPEIFYLPIEWMTPDGKVFKKGDNLFGDLNKKILTGNVFGCMGVFLRRDVALGNLHSEERKLSGTEDWLLWLKLSARYKFHYSNVITSVLVDHSGRSVVNFDEVAMMDRTNLLIRELEADKVFMDKLGGHIPALRAHMYSYIALHLVLDNKKAVGVKFLLKAVGTNWREVFTRRTLAIVKHIVLPG